MPQAKSFILLVFSLILIPNLHAEIPSVIPIKIRNSVVLKNYKQAVADLESLRNEDSKTFFANNYDYLLARVYEKRGDFAKAAAHFESVVRRDSILKEYALWHLAQIMRNSGNLFIERMYLRELSAISEESLLRDAFAKRLSRSNFESGNYRDTISILTRSTSSEELNDSEKGNERTQSRDELVLLGNAYLEINDIGKAKEIFRELIDNPPNVNQPDDFALSGAKGLDRLEGGEKNFGKSAAKLSEEEHLKRAKIYQFNRNFDLARLHFEAVVDNYTESEHSPFSMFQIGRGFSQERNYSKALEWFEHLLTEFPSDKLAASALYNLASTHANLKNTAKAVSSYEKYINENPDANNLERAHLNIIDAYRDANDDKRALEWALKTQETFRDEMGEAVALFSQIRIRISQEDWQNVLGDLNRLKELKNLGGVRIAGGTNKAEVQFLRGFVLEKLGRFGEAIDVYLSIPSGQKEFYGWRATERLNGLAANEKTAPLIDQKRKRLLSVTEQTLTNSNTNEIRIAAQKALRLTKEQDARLKLLARIKRANSLLEDYKAIPTPSSIDFGRKTILQTPARFSAANRHQILADELLFLGLYDEGTPELEIALRKTSAENSTNRSDFLPNAAFTIAQFYARGDVANRAVRYIESKYRKIPKDYPLELIPREHLELLYPKPYQESLTKYAREKNVDPRFVLAIMRQESRFQADIKSAAAARGLMQFISNTSNKMAQDMRIENFAQDDLYHPPTAIRFGSHYIANIFKDFPGKPAAVAASYNGGEDRMMRWFKRAKSDEPDRFVPEIIFSQTKDYAYKVMSNYRVYRLLYDENLKPIKPDK